MAFSKDDIDYMRKQGMSDDDIINGLSQEDPQLAKDIDYAKGHGIAHKDILSHIDELAQGAGDASSKDATTDNGKSTGYLDALKYGASKALQGTGKTLESFDVTKDVGSRLENYGKDFDNSDIYQPTHMTLNPSTWVQAPRALLESGPSAAASIAGGAAGAAAGGLVGGPVGAGIGGLAGAGFGGDLSYLGNNLQNRLNNNGQNNTPLSDASTLDKLVAGGTAFGQGALNRVGVGGAINPATKGAGLAALSQIPGQVAKAAGTGAIANAGSEALGQIGDTAGTNAGIGAVDLGQIANAAGAGAAMGGMGRLAKAGVQDIPQSARFAEAAAHPNAARDVASILQDTGENLNTPKGQYKALKSAADTLGDEISDKADAVKTADPTTTDLVDNTVKQLDKGKTLNDDQMQSVQDTLKSVQGGDDLMDSFKKMHVLNDLKSKGKVDDTSKTVTGGFNSGILGTITNPIGALAKKSPTALTMGAAAGSYPVGEALTHAVQHGGIEALTGAAGTAVPVLGALAAAKLGVRGVDAATGFNKPVSQFVQRFGEDAKAVDPIMQAAQNAAQARQALASNNAPQSATPAPGPSNAPVTAAPAPVAGGVIQLAQAAAARAQAKQAQQPVQQQQANAAPAPAAPASTIDPAILARLQARNGKGAQDNTGAQASAPAGDSYNYHGIDFPIPDDVRYKPGYIKSLKRNQDLINDTLDKQAWGEHGVMDPKTADAIENNRTALKTARNQDDARGVVNRIMRQSHPDDRPQLKKAFNTDFYSIWSKKKAGPKE